MQIRRAVCINLDHRTDRWEQFCRETASWKLHVERLSAVDGMAHGLTREEAEIFQGNDYGYAAGMVGCALSHLAALRQFAGDTDAHPTADWFLVFEDDTHFSAGFEAALERLLGSFAPFDLVFLSTSEQIPRKRAEDFSCLGSPAQAPWVVPAQRLGNLFHFSMGGIMAYMVNRRGAETLLAYLHSVRLVNCIDTQMLRAAMEGAVAAGFVVPTDGLCHSPVANGNPHADTNIQKPPYLVPIRMAK